MKYKIADLIIEYEPKYTMSKLRSDKYKIEDTAKIDYKLEITDDNIEKRNFRKYDKRNQ